MTDERLRREWEDFVSLRPRATVYHNWAWGAVGRTLGHRPLPLVIRDAGEALEGVLPLFQVGRGRTSRLAAVPLRDRGGPLADSPSSVARLMTEAAGLAHELSSSRVILRSEVPLTDPAREAGYAESAYHLTTLVDLSGGEDEVLARVRGSARRGAAKGVEAGLEFRWADSERDWRSFYHLFLRTRRRLGVPPHPWAFFHAMREQLGAQCARLALASAGDRDVAAMLVFTYGERAIDGYAASDDSQRVVRPNDFIIWNTLGWAAREGFRWFDFGASSPEQKGLLSFKEKWGGRHTPLYSYTWPATATPAPRDSNREEYRLARAAWRRLPIWATRLAGPPIIRGLD